ncbi:MAG: Peptide deformylase [Firmicutes bacterium ADurb.Bin506]|nr:MAG: Peptide deformylase [Firmicutes bacterium ADurb.Bin506]
MILKIRTEGDPVLRMKAKPVTQIDDTMRKLASDMLETMYAAPGVGLAAPQVGELVRLVVIDVGDGPEVLFNPEIVSFTGEAVDVEGCLSIPGMQGMVKRAAHVVVTADDRYGRKIRLAGGGMLAKALQHEIDHLDGILYVDKAYDIGPAEVDEDEQEES